MNDAPLGSGLALGLTRRQVNSARPDAPVVSDPDPRPPHRLRAHTASALRRIADTLEPCPPLVPSLGTSLRSAGGG